MAYNLSNLAKLIKKEVKGLHIVGSLGRNSKNIIGDIDFVTSRNLGEIIININKAFNPLGIGAKIMLFGNKYASLLFDNHINIDIWKADNKNELKYLKINRKIDKGHNIAYRKKAKELGFKLNDFGLFEGDKQITYNNENELRNLLNIKSKAGAKPLNMELYNRIKNDIYSKNKKHSLFRSASIVKEYKKQGGLFEDEQGQNNKMNIKRWFGQRWASANDYYHLNKVVPCGSSNTQVKFNEYPLCRPLSILLKLDKTQLKKLIDEKNKLKEKHLKTKNVLNTNQFNIKNTITGTI